MKVLGIESSCDETAAAVVEDAKTPGLRLLSNVVSSSVDLHVAYGGVVPEIAARSHIEVILPVIHQALTDADCDWPDIDAIAVTQGPGLGGSLLIGVLTARTLAIAHQKPLYAVNHIEAHPYANFITSAPSLPAYHLPAAAPSFPMLALIVSGGHTQLVLWKDHFHYQVLGRTTDDAIGEAFDKVAKMTGLPYPGGPSIAKAAERGNPLAIALPKAKTADTYGFSYSGLKTAVLRAAQELCGKDYAFPSKKLPELLSEAQKADIAASFQRVAVESVVDKTVAAYEEFRPRSVVIAGGVAANQELRRQLSARLPLPIEYTDTKLCTDNGAMVAALGYFKVYSQMPPSNPNTLPALPNLKM